MGTHKLQDELVVVEKVESSSWRPLRSHTGFWLGQELLQ